MLLMGSTVYQTVDEFDGLDGNEQLATLAQDVEVGERSDLPAHRLHAVPLLRLRRPECAEQLLEGTTEQASAPSSRRGLVDPSTSMKGKMTVPVGRSDLMRRDHPLQPDSRPAGATGDAGPHAGPSTFLLPRALAEVGWPPAKTRSRRRLSRR